MSYKRQSGTKFSFSIRQWKNNLNKVDFLIKDSIISFQIHNYFTSDKELYKILFIFYRFLNNTLDITTETVLNLDSIDNDKFIIIEFTNNNTMGGVDIGEKLMEMKILYPTNYKTDCGDSIAFALTKEDVKYFFDVLDNWKKGKEIVRQKEDNLDGPTMLVRQKDGGHICVPFSKLACYKNTKNNKYRDIANEERYNEDWDKIVFAFIENGHGSHALAQKITNKSYAYCGRIMDFLAILGYIDTGKI